MALNTEYKPVKVSDFESSKLNFTGKSIMSEVIGGASTNIDLRLDDDVLMTGGQVIVENAKFGDSIKLQIVDVTGTYAPPGTVLNEFISKWVIAGGSSSFMIDIPYPAKIFGTLYIRVIYTSIGIVPPTIAVNYSMHKVLI